MATTYTAGQARLEIIPDMSRFGAKLRAATTGQNHTVRVGVDVDSASLRALDAQLRGLRPQRVRVGVDVDSSPLDKLGGLATGAAGKVQLIAVAAAAAGAAVAVLPGLLAAAGGAVGVLGLSLRGVGEALQGYKADQDAAGKAAATSAALTTANARAIRDANQQISDARKDAARTARDGAERIDEALRNQQRVERETAKAVVDARRAQRDAAENGVRALEQASRRVGDALKAEQRAQEDLTRARKDAAYQLEDLQERVSDYALDSREATIALRKAEEDHALVMRAGGATAEQREQSEINLMRARDRLTDISREAGRAQLELIDAENKGVEGSDLVTSAKERQAQASQSVTDANEDLVRTQRDVAQANEDAAIRVAAAVTASSEQQAEAERQVATARRDAAEANEEASIRVARALQNLADVQAQQAEQASVAAASSSKFADAMKELSPAAQALVMQLIAMKPLLDQLTGTAAAAFLPGLTQMLKDSTSLFPIFNDFLRQSGEIMGQTARDFGQLFKSEEFQANLRATLEAGLPLIEAFGDAMLVLTDAWFQMGAASGPATQGLADFVGLISQGLADFLVAMTPAMEAFGDIWRSLGEVLGSLLEALGPIIAALANALAPVIVALTPVITMLVDRLGGLLVQAIIMLTPLVVRVAEVVADLAMQFGDFLLDAIEQLLPLLPPLIEAGLRLLDALEPIIPILIDFATQVIEALLPYLPELVDVLVKLIDEAIIPLIPPLLDIVKLILPDFIQLIKWLTPLVVWLAENIVDELAYGVEHVLIPALRWMKENWVSLGDALEWVWLNVIKPAWDAMTRGLDWVGQKFQDTVGWIKDKWTSLKSILAKPINFLINTVWNDGIRKAWNVVADLLPGVEPVGPLASIPEFARGGKLDGGTPGKDSILLKAMPGEYILPTAMARSIGYDNLDAARRSFLTGSGFADEGMFSSLPGYAQGGRIAEAKAFAQSQDNKRYQWGGVGNPSWDCSGFMSGIQNVLMGRPPRSRLYTTSAFGPRRGAAGMVPFGGRGGGSAFTVGVQEGHMGGTLDGVNVESGSSNGVQYGPPARGTSSFPWKFYLPQVGGQFVDPGPGGGGFFDWLGDLLGKITDTFSGPMHKLVDTIPFDSPPQFLGVPKKLGHHIIDKATAWFKDDANNAVPVGGGDGPISYGTGPVQDQVRAVANSFGWGGGPQWDALARLIQKESSWNPTAANPRSSAYGLFQFLDSTWAGQGGSKSSNPSYQATLGLRYIKSRYRDPLGALAFHNRNNWYDSGGWLPPGATMAQNNTGVPEAVLTGRQWDSIQSLAARAIGGDGASTINVYPAQGQDERQIASNVQRVRNFQARAI